MGMGAAAATSFIVRRALFRRRRPEHTMNYGLLKQKFSLMRFYCFTYSFECLDFIFQVNQSDFFGALVRMLPRSACDAARARGLHCCARRRPAERCARSVFMRLWP